MKKYYSEINLLSFNNKEMIVETWNTLKKSIDDIINLDNQKIDNFDDLLDDTSESDDTDDTDECEIKYKGKTYILNNNNLYTINIIGNKDKLYGNYVNGKIIKK